MTTVSPYLGIDFGATTTTMAWIEPHTGKAKVLVNQEGETQTPSVIYWGREPLVGSPAFLKFSETKIAARFFRESKRDLANNQVISLPDGQRIDQLAVLSALIGKMKHDAERLHFHQPVQRVVMTFPSSFDLLEQEKLSEAATLAGFSEVILIEAPIAAALAYAKMSVQTERHILIYDLGGGSCEIAALVKEGDSFRFALEPRGLRHIGGWDFDQLLYHYCRDSQNTPAFFVKGKLDPYCLKACQEGKEQLSFVTSVDIGCEEAKPCILSRPQFETLIQRFIDSTVERTERLWQDAETRGYPIEKLLILGRSSRIPLVQQQLKKALPIPIASWEEQDFAVVFGAAYHAVQQWDIPLTSNPRAENRSSKVGHRWRVGNTETCKTIQQAFTQAQADDEILIQPGIYRESLYLNKPISLIGDGPIELITLEGAEAPCITMATSHALIRGITIKGVGSSQGKEFAAIECNYGQLTIENSDITSDSLACVAVYGTHTRPILRKCVIYGSRSTGIFFFNGSRGLVEECEIFANQQMGIAVAKGASPTIRRCQIHDGDYIGVIFYAHAQGVLESCEIYANRASGIVIRDHSNPWIDRCKIYGSREGSGILVCNEAFGMMTECEIYDNRMAGIISKENANPAIRRCQFRDGHDSGILACDKGRGIVEGCTIHHHRQSGITIKTDAYLEVRDCQIYQNHWEGVWAYQGGGGHFTRCHLSDNQEGDTDIGLDCQVTWDTELPNT